MEICIDFDATICMHEYPAVGAPVPNALEVIRKLQLNGHNIILWTMRSGATLDDAVNYLGSNNIALYGINENPSQKGWTTSPKAHANLVIDDIGLGCPLSQTDGRAHVDWFIVEKWLIVRGII